MEWLIFNVAIVMTLNDLVVYKVINMREQNCLEFRLDDDDATPLSPE